MNESSRKITKHTELIVYQKAFEAAMEIYRLSKNFPKDEAYSLTDQIRRSSRSVCANLAEGWRRRRYRAAFLNKLNECEAEAGETQAGIQFSVECGHLERETGSRLYQSYNEIISIFIQMINHPDKWLLSQPK